MSHSRPTARSAPAGICRTSVCGTSPSVWGVLRRRCCCAGACSGIWSSSRSRRTATASRRTLRSSTSRCPTRTWPRSTRSTKWAAPSARSSAPGGNASAAPDRRVRLACEILILGHELAGNERRALRVADDGHPDPGGVEGRDDHRATELRGLRRRGVGVVDREGLAPMRRRVRLVVRDRIDAGDDVLETLWRAPLRHLLAEVGVVTLEVVAVPGQRPHLGPAIQDERSPAEHRAVERLRLSDLAGVERIEVQGAILVDDPRALVLLRLPGAER